MAGRRLGLAGVAVAAGLCTPALTGAPTTFSFTVFGRAEGLPGNAVRCLLQDREGYLWIGLEQGLSRFDGRRFRAYGPASGLPAGTVHSIHEAQDGTLWIGTDSGIAFRAGSGFQTAQNWPGVSADGAITSAGGTLYVAGKTGLLRGSSRPGGSFERIAAPAAAGSNPARSLFIDAAGTLWATVGTTLCRLGNGGLEAYGREAGLPESNWQAVTRDAEGTLWVRDAAQIWFQRRAATRFERWQEAALPSGYAGLYLSPAGTAAIPGRGGVRLLSGDPVGLLTTERGLPAIHVGSLLWDRNGNLWLGLPEEGLAMLRGKGRWSGWSTAQGLSSPEVTSVRRDSAGRLWAGTRLGLNLFEPSTQKWLVFTTQNGLPNDDIRSLAADRAGGLWIGCDPGGLARMDTRTRQIRRFGAESGLGNNRIVMIDVDRENRVWVMTREGVYRTGAGGPWTFEKSAFPVVEEGRLIYRVVHARDGTLWAAGDPGLLRLRNSAWEVLGPEIGLRDRRLLFVADGPNETPWVGYAGKLGVSRVEWYGSTARVTHFGFPDSLPGPDVSFLEEDRKGRMWVGSNHGVAAFDGTAWHRYLRDDGLMGDVTNLNAFWEDGDGTIFIGTNRGLSVFRAPDVLEPQTSPPVTISAVRMGAREAGPAQTEMPWGDRTAEFDLAVLDFTSQQSVRYRYRLLGSSEDWVETGEGRALFPELAPGHYVFEVTSSVRGAPWNAAVTRRELHVLAPWWGTWWFRLLAAGTVALGLWLGARRRLRSRLRR